MAKTLAATRRRGRVDRPGLWGGPGRGPGDSTVASTCPIRSASLRARARRPLAVLALVVGLGVLPARAKPPVPLPVATARDVDARDRLFQRGFPVAPESFSPTGDHYAHLHFVRGGWLKRKPRRCVFLMDLRTGEDHAIPTPEGTAERLGGWDPTGRYLLVEATSPDLLFALTGNYSTYHWVFDAVTAEYVARRPFTGTRDGQRFRWKAPNLYHGAWNEDHDARVWPLYEGELARQYQARQQELAEEDARRRTLADRLAMRPGGGALKPLGDVLDRLDSHWTQRGQRDPVVSDLFGDRPALLCRCGDDWMEIGGETEYVAVLDHDLALITDHGGAQLVLNAAREEILPLPPPPAGWVDVLDRRWDRTGGYYDEADPLPRDLQYRRSWDATGGTAQYFNYITPDGSCLLMLYSFGAERRVLRIVDLPETWHTGKATASGSAGEVDVTPGAEPGPSGD